MKQKKQNSTFANHHSKIDIRKSQFDNQHPSFENHHSSFDLPEDWKVVRLGEVIIPDRKKIKAKDYFGDEKIVEKIPFDTGKIILREKKKTGTDLYKSVKNRLLISKINLHQGAVAITNETIVATTHYEFYRVLPTSDILYFWYYLRSNIFKDLFANEIKFRGYKKEANYNFIKDFQIPLPPLPEQKKIAYVLSTVQEAKEKTENHIKALKEFKKSMMKHLFSYGPVSITDTDKTELKDTEIGKIPKHWEVGRIEDYVLRTEQKDMRKLNIEFKYIDVSSVNKEFLKIQNYSILKGKNSPSRARKILKHKDIIIATVRPTLKRIARIDKDFDGQVCSTAFCVLRVNESKVYHNFLFYVLQRDEFIYELQKIQKGANYPSVTDSEVKKQKIPLPPLPEQEQIASILSAIDERIEAEEKKKKALDEVFKSLLKDLMTARIRVKDINLGSK